MNNRDAPLTDRDTIQPAAVAGTCIGLALILGALAAAAQLSLADWALVAAGFAIILCLSVGAGVLLGALCMLRETGTPRTLDEIDIPFAVTERYGSRRPPVADHRKGNPLCGSHHIRWHTPPRDYAE